MAEPLLTKDAIDIGGHKLPLPLIGALAAVAGVLVVMRARNKGASVVSSGSQPATSAPAAPVYAPDPSAALANLSQQIASLQQALIPPASAPAPTPTPTPVATMPGWVGTPCVDSIQSGPGGCLGFRGPATVIGPGWRWSVGG